MASNIHKDLSDAQLHNPKGFSTAGVNTKLTKDATGNLSWIPDTAGGVTSIVAGTNVTISPSEGTGDVTINADAGESCGLYKDYMYGRLSKDISVSASKGSSAMVELNRMPITATFGQVGQRNRLDVIMVLAPSATDAQIGDFWLTIVGDNGQRIACNLGSYSHAPRDCGEAGEECGGATDTATRYINAHWSIDFDVLGSDITALTIVLGSGCESYLIKAGYSSLVLKNYCLAPAPFDLADGVGSEAPKEK